MVLLNILDVTAFIIALMRVLLGWMKGKTSRVKFVIKNKILI
jgi:hypothetical protein